MEPSGKNFDIIVVGSGPSGVHAAKSAVESGASIAMVDVGHTDEHYAPLIPDKPFSEIRRSDPDQRRYFLGDDLEGLGGSGHSTGAQLTPPRMFITKDVEKFLPLTSETFSPMQSLALGGLAAGWGAGSAAYEDFELRRSGLPVEEIRRYYGEVAKDIGISGATDDDISPHIADFPHIQEPLEIDSNAEALFNTYKKSREKMVSKGFKLGRPPVAILSRPLGERLPNPYHDMDFWSDARESIYRPKYTVRELLMKPNFTYIHQTLAVRFKESVGEPIFLEVDNVRTRKGSTLRCRRLILAAGALNTARLVLRSLNRLNTPVPILSNPYTYVPVLNLPMLGKPARDRRHSMVQLTALYRPLDAPEDEVIIQFYSYRSMMLFRLVREMPAPPWLGLLIARLILTSLFIVGINHADTPSSERYLELVRDGDGDRLHAHYGRSPEEMKRLKRHERAVLKRLLSLRCVPMQRIRLKAGASIHYAGTLPFSDRDEPLTCTPEGRIRGTHHVYAADGTPWKYLPAKGLTLTLMANARRIADAVTKDLLKS